jgi:threonine/homoserine/homoserine lactone efflux protein
MSSVSHQEMETNTYLFPMIKSSFLLGLLLSTLNPMHIPFWMGWNSILLERKTLDKSPGIYSSYIIGIGLGSIAALMIFIFTGKFIYQNYQQYNHVIAFIMGCLYLGFSFYIMVLFYKKHLKLNIV